MTTFRFSLLAIALAGAASAQEFSEPSGLMVSLFGVIVEADPAILPAFQPFSLSA